MAEAYISELEKQYGIPDGLYDAVLNKGERSGPMAVSSAGAIGRAQLMPATARDMGLQGNDIWDDRKNVAGGAKYLKWLHEQLDDWPLAVAAYNDGIGNVRKAGGIPEASQGYVTRVMGMDQQNPAMAYQEDPARKKMMADLATATGAATQANNEMAESLKGSVEEQEKIKGALHEDVEHVPLPPTLRDLPEPPDPKESLKDPQRALGQFLPALAVLASVTTRHAATTAFKSAAAAMKAQKENDQETLQVTHQKWKDDMEKALDSWNSERDRYLDIINNKKMTMEERLSELRVQAAMDDNKRLMAAAAVGNVDMIYKNLQAGDMAAYRLATVLNTSNRNDTQREAQKEKERADRAHESYQRDELTLKQASLNKQTLSQWVASKLQEKADHPDDWNDSQEALLARAEADLQRLNLGGGTDPAAPAAAPAPGGHGGPAAAGASKETAAPLPKDKKELQVNRWYIGAGGQRKKWNGTAFVDQ